MVRGGVGSVAGQPRAHRGIIEERAGYSVGIDEDYQPDGLVKAPFASVKVGRN